jgi:hypothetical protein
MDCFILVVPIVVFLLRIGVFSLCKGMVFYCAFGGGLMV